MAPGTYSYLLGGDVKATDLAGGLTGSVTIDSSGIGYITVTAVADNTTDGDENMTITIGGKTSTTVVRVLDTSQTPAPSPLTIPLTSGSNVLSGNSANDIFDGSLNSSSQMTLNSFDTLTGGLGTDSLSAVINAAVTVQPTLSGIENVSVQFVTAGTGVLSLQNTSGVTSVENTNSSVAGSFTNLSSTAIALKDTGTGSAITYGFTAAAVAGSADTATLTLSNTTGGTVTMSGVETVNIVSADAPNTIDASGIAATTVNVSGTQNTALGTVNAAVSTLNASALTTGTFSATMGAVAAATVTGSPGADTLNVNAVTGNVNVNTGTGNDTVTITSSLTATDTLNGGDGTDTLSTNINQVDTTATATAFTNISNFETLSIANALANTLTTARVQAGFNQVTLAAGGAGTINLEAGARTVRLGGALTGGLTVNDTGVATNDALTISNGASATDTGAGQALTIGGFESTTIADTGSGAATAQSFGSIGITPDTGGAASLLLTGSNSITIGAVTATSATSLTIDGSGLTGSATLTQSAAPVRATITTGATNIIGSANADSLIAANTGSSIDGGAGNDQITGGTGNDSLTGGLGDDTFVMAGNFDNADTLVGGAGNDTLSVTSSEADVTFTNTTGVETVAQVGTVTLTLGALAAAAGINRVTLGAVGSVETTNVGAGFTNDLTVVMAATGTQDADVVSATGYTRNLTIQVANATGLAQNGTYTGGSGTADRIVYNLAGNSVTQATNTGITAIESITTTGSGANSLTVALADANTAFNTTMTVDGSGLNAGGVLTVDGSLEADGRLVVIGGTSADAITGTQSSYGDNLSGGDGNDTFTMGGNLTSLDTIAGGNGTDTITISAATVDAGFTNVTSVESLTATANVTLGALARAAGITSVTESTTLTVGSGFAAPLAVTLASAGTASVVGTGYTNVLTVTTADSGTSITSSDTITGGSGTSDRLVFNLTTNALTESAANLANVSAVENFSFTGSTLRNASITLADANIASARSLTIDGSSLSTGTLTVDAALESNGSVVVIGGSANDAFTGSQSTLGDNFSGGAGDDTFTFATANLSSLDTIAGGAGSDTLQMSNAATLIDTSFTNVTGVEILTVNAATLGATLGALANGSGLTTVTASGTNALTLTVGAGFTNALRVNLATGATTDNISASASAAALDIRGTVGLVSATDTIQGGTSTGDALTLTADSNTATTTLMTGIETINLVANGTNTATITLGANNTQIAAGRTLTINGASLVSTSAALTVNGTASETDGFMSITGGNGNDALTGSASTDTISGGLGNDTITGGLGADNLTGGTGNDVFVFNAVADSSGANIDTVTDWTSAADKLNITLDYSTNTSAGLTINTNRATTTAITSIGAAQDSLSGDRGQWVYDTSTSQLYVNFNADNLITSSDYRIGLSAGSTAGNTVVNGDINFVINGGSGADSITGGQGADTISGGAGANVYYYNTGDAPTGESITGGANTDTLVVSTSTTFVNATFGAAGTVLTSGSVDNIVITSGTTGTFTAAQLTGQGINVNATAAAAANLVITGSNATADFTNLTFTVSGGANAFDTGVDTVTINIGSVTAASTTGTTLADVITGSALADTILGGTGADTINAAAGIDVITGGAGNDTINPGSDTDADKIVFSGGTTLAAQSSANGVDTITGFVSASDTINVAALGDGTTGAAATAITAAAAQGALTSDQSIVISTTGAAANLTTGGTAVVTDFTNMTQVAAYLSERFTVTAGSSTNVFVINLTSGNNDTTYVYSFVDASGTSIVAAEIQLMGTITHTAGTALVNANVVYA